jgi:hypothetical protein
MQANFQRQLDLFLLKLDSNDAANFAVSLIPSSTGSNTSLGVRLSKINPIADLGNLEAPDRGTPSPLW